MVVWRKQLEETNGRVWGEGFSICRVPVGGQRGQRVQRYSIVVLRSGVGEERWW